MDEQTGRIGGRTKAEPPTKFAGARRGLTIRLQGTEAQRVHLFDWSRRTEALA